MIFCEEVSSGIAYALTSVLTGGLITANVAHAVNGTGAGKTTPQGMCPGSTRIRRGFTKAVHLRHVSTGPDGVVEWRLNVG